MPMLPFWPRVASLWRAFVHRTRLDAELDEELRGFVEALAARHVRDGMAPDAAHRAALAEAGNLDRVKDAVREGRISHGVETTIQDLRFAWRGLLRAPGFAAVAILTLALGIGANTAIFSVVRAMLLAPLPFQDSSRLVATLDPQLPVYDMRRLDDYVVGARAAQRFTAIVAASFAAVALVLAAVGVYGVIAYATARRRYEFGVRLALGAQPGQVTALVFREGALLASIGLAGGVVCAAVAARFLEAQLFAVSPRDATSYVVAAVAIGVSALTACWLPARRAASVSPLDAIRAE